MLAPFRTEMSKQWRRPRTYVALSVTVAVPIIVTLALKANPPSAPSGEGQGFFYLATQSGLLLPVAALRVMSRFLLVVIIALFAGDAIASEASWGNLRALLVRPIGRGRLLGAKLASVAVMAVLATTLIVVAGLLAGGVAFGWQPVDLFILHLSTGEVIGNLALSVLYVTWSLSPILALGFMVSTMTDSPAAASFTAFGLYLVSSIMDGIGALGSIRDGLPTHYLDAWSDLFTRSGASSDLRIGLFVPLGYLVAFCAVAWWWFRRKDILS